MQPLSTLILDQIRLDGMGDCNYETCPIGFKLNGYKALAEQKLSNMSLTINGVKEEVTEIKNNLNSHMNTEEEYHRKVDRHITSVRIIYKVAITLGVALLGAIAWVIKLLGDLLKIYLQNGGLS